MRNRLTAPIDGKRLAAKTERGDLQEIVVGSFEVQWRSTASDSSAAVMPGAVIGDRDKRLARHPQRDVDAVGAGVDRVLDQLLDRRRRALDHLARGDAVDENRRQLADRHCRTVYAMAALGSETFSPGTG